MEVKNKNTITITIVALITTVAASLTSLVRLAFADCNPTKGATDCSPWQLGWNDAYYNYYGGSPKPGHHSPEYMNGFQVGLSARVHGDATHPPAIAPTQRIPVGS